MEIDGEFLVGSGEKGAGRGRVGEGSMSSFKNLLGDWGGPGGGGGGDVLGPPLF